MNNDSYEYLCWVLVPCPCSHEDFSGLPGSLRACGQENAAAPQVYGAPEGEIDAGVRSTSIDDSDSWCEVMTRELLSESEKVLASSLHDLLMPKLMGSSTITYSNNSVSITFGINASHNTCGNEMI